MNPGFYLNSCQSSAQDPNMVRSPLAIVRPSHEGTMKRLQDMRHIFAAAASGDVRVLKEPGVDLRAAYKLTRELAGDVAFVLNSTQPALRLPYEILCMIFRLVRGPVFAYRPDTCEHEAADKVHTMHRWMRVTRVCRRWRAVATSIPSLWSVIVINDDLNYDIQCADGPYPDFFLHRSAGRPLRVFIGSCSTKQSSEAALWVLHHMYRIEELCIISATAFDERHFELLRTPAPKLKALVAFPTTTTIEYALRGVISGFESPSWPFDFNLPKLRSLAIGLYTDLHAVNYANIRQLHISHGRRVQNEDFMQRLLVSLSQAARLQDLIISQCTFGDRHWHDSTHDHRAVLPKLQRLTLHHVRGIARLLGALKLPDTVYLTIRGEFDDSAAVLPDEAATLGPVAEPRRLVLSFDSHAFRLFGLGPTAAFQVEIVHASDKSEQPPSLNFGSVLRHIEELLILDGRGRSESYAERQSVLMRLIQDIVQSTTVDRLRKVTVQLRKPSLFAQCLPVLALSSPHSSTREVVTGEYTSTMVEELHIFDPSHEDCEDTVAALRSARDAGVGVASLRVAQTQEKGPKANFWNPGGFDVWRGIETLPGEGVVGEATWDEEMQLSPWRMVGYPPVCGSRTMETWEWPEWRMR